MRLLIGAVFAIALLSGACQATEQPEDETPAAATPAATATTPVEVTPTPDECDEKCQVLQTFTPLPTPTIAPAADAYPPGTRTGVELVDAVIAAIEDNDTARLQSLISLTTLPCVAQGNRQPEPLLCRDGVAPGTPKSGIWVTHVEGGLAEGSQRVHAERIIQAARSAGWKLHSVYSFADAGITPEWLPETLFFVTFTAWHPQAGPWFDNLRISAEGITGLHYAFGEPYPAWENPSDPGWLLPRAR